MALLAKVKDIFKGGSSNKKKKVYHNVKLENPEEAWYVECELGDGAYGKVYKAVRKENGQLAALKQVVLDGEDDLETYMIEIDILAECKHPNIVELLEAYHYDGKLWMYLEYCDGGAVDSIMVDLDRPLTEPQISNLCYGICNALIYIHSNKVIHRDLKAGNVLLTMEGGVKLADFGVSAKNKNTFDKRGTFIGTPYWLAPEVILCETFIDAKYDYKADIWSLGISLIEFAQMDPPNHEVSPVRVMLKIQKSDPPKLDYPSRWSKEFNDFIAKCLTKDPELRPSAEDLLKHPFLSSKSNDKKAIVDLLLEYKADVVVEEVVDDSEDQDRQSSVPDSYSNSTQVDTNSVISLGKDSALEDDELPSSTSEDREVGVSIPSERRMSKGPAPPPPVSSGNQVLPKKGPAPAVPAVSPPIATATSAAPIASDHTPDTTTVNNTSSSPNRSASLDSHPFESAPSTPTIENPSVAAASPPSDSSVSTVTAVAAAIDAATHIQDEVKSSEELAKPSTPLELEAKNVIDAIPVAKSVVVFDADAAIGVVPSTEIVVAQDVEIVDDSHSSPSYDVSFTANSEPSQGISSQEAIKNDSPVHSPSSPSSLPVTLSVVTPNKNATLEGTISDPSDVLLASISSEGTVIVRTSTPTSAALSTPSASLPEVSTSLNDSVVTCSVAGESREDMESEAFQESTDQEKSPVAVTLVGHVPDSALEAASLDSLGEAESQAVQILETAINSALNNSFTGTLESVSSPSSFVIEKESSAETKGEVVVVASGSETDVSVIDISGHRLDHSEVLISSSSIPEDEQKSKAQQPRLDISVDDHPAPLLSPSDNTPAPTEGSDTHVSVVSVAEQVIGEVTIVNDESTVITAEILTDEGVETPTQQMSLTIEGTTVGDTDVDEVESPAVSQAEKMPDAPSVNAYTDHESDVLSEDNSSITTIKTPTTDAASPVAPVVDQDSVTEGEGVPLKPIQNGVRRQNSRASDRSDTDTISTLGSDKENRHVKEDADFGEEVTLRSPRRNLLKPSTSPSTAAKNLKNKELQESIALRKKTRKRTRKFVIDGVVVTTTTSKVIYGDDEEQGMLSSAHLKRKQELRELKLLQKREQKQFQDLALKANIAKQEQEKKFEVEKANLLRNYDSQIENLIRQQKQMVEKAEARQEAELKTESKKTRIEQERELKVFRETLKQEWKLLKQEIDLLPKDKRKETFKIRKEQLDKDQTEREKAYLERLNDSHEMALKRLNDRHRQHIALKEKQFLEEKHQLLRTRESALWALEERHIQDKHQLAKEQLKDIYFLQRLQMTNRHTTELEQVRRYNQQNEENLLKRQSEERRQLPKRIRQEMKTREKMFREQIRISMTNLASHDQEKDQLKKFQEQEKIKYDKERKRAEMKHKKQMEELKAASEASIKELVHLQNEKGKLLTEHETYKLKSLDDEYQKELKEWKSNLVPRKKKLEDDFRKQMEEQVKFYGDYLDRELELSTSSQSTTSLASSHH